MLRHGSWVVLFMTLARSAHAQGTAATGMPSSTSAEMTPESRKARVSALVAKAKREARAGRFPEAVLAYSDAFDLEQDPRVGGQLGVLLVELDNAVVAADLLMNAIERARDAPASERLEFFKAYEVAQSRVCRLEVTVSEAHAKILLDGKVTQEDGISGFAMFVRPGEHELRAKLPGFRDAVAHVVATKGGILSIELKLERDVEPLPELPTSGAALASPKLVLPPLQQSSNVATDPNYSTKEDPFYEPPKPDKPKEKQGPRFSLAAGIVTVFGVASWSPAVGPVVGIGLRPKEYVSFGLEGRAAWLTTPVADSAISAMTAGGLLSACGHLKWFFGCGLGHLGVILMETDPASFKAATFTDVKLGGGLRVGARFELTKSLRIEASADALLLNVGTKVFLEQTLIIDQPPAMIGAQIASGWEF